MHFRHFEMLPVNATILLNFCFHIPGACIPAWNLSISHTKWQMETAPVRLLPWHHLPLDLGFSLIRFWLDVVSWVICKVWGSPSIALCRECRHLKLLFYGPIKCSKLPVMCSHCLMRTPAPTLHHTPPSSLSDLWQFHDTSCLFYFIYIVKSNTLYQYTTECHI